MSKARTNIMMMAALTAALGMSMPVERPRYGLPRMGGGRRSEGFTVNEKGKQMQRFRVKKPRNRK